MPRRKVTMGLIPNRRVRANTFGKRKQGLKKKASELSTLCGVRVALVCADGSGSGSGAAADVWESAPGVLDAYREVPPEERAKHTHRAYAEAELRKAEAKLVRVRQEGPPALAPWDAAVFALSPDEAQRRLGAVEEALRAVGARRTALGMPADDDDGGDGWPMGFAAAAPGGASDAIGLADPSTFDGSNGLSLDRYMLCAQGNNANEQQVVWDNGFDPCSAAMNCWQQPGYAFQQCGADHVDVYQLQMADMYGANGNFNNSTGRLPWDAFHPATNAVAMTTEPTGYGTGTDNSYVGGIMPSYLTQQCPSSNAIVPLGYPSGLEMGLNYLDGVGQAAQQGIGGGRSFAGSNFDAAAAALSLTMGTGDCFVNALQAQPLAMSYTGDLLNAGDHASQWHTGQQPAIQK
ncbi:hypothetical protein QOZ80_2BG0168620 [Eleusine coracana subsp. coracana]|nr:hypothetical protein QOZ80_2BG0168620 [Eleusine coracana subsp. coracana]